MVKRRTIRDRVIDRAEKGEDSKPEEESLPNVAKTKHFQKKLNKRLTFADRIKEKNDAALATKAAIGKKKRGGKKNTLSNLHDLMDTLPDTSNASSNSRSSVQAIKMAPKVLKSKARTKLVSSEVERFNAILAHPAFKANPMEAIKTHLAASLEATEAKRLQKPGETKSAKRRKAKQNKGSMDES